MAYKVKGKKLKSRRITKQVFFKEDINAKSVQKMIDDKNIKVLYVTSVGTYATRYSVFYKKK
jgi:hypothetical protein